MTWTYAPPVGGVWPSTIAEIRFLVGDRVQTAQSISDEEIEALIATWVADNGSPVDVYAVASLVADSMATGFEAEADSVSKKVGNSSLAKSWSSRSTRYRDLAARLAARATRGIVGGSLSGMGISTDNRDSEAAFELRQFDDGSQQ